MFHESFHGSKRKSEKLITGLENNAIQQSGLSRHTSFIIGQKLRESKWFSYDEMRIFCAVLESGFIVQHKDSEQNFQWGITLWTAGCEKSKNSDHIKVYTLKMYKGHYKVVSYPLLEFWPEGTFIKINNQMDRNNIAHNEEVIRNQIIYAEKHREKWHNCDHFLYWCRYGEIKMIHRLKQISDSMKWGNFGLNVGLLLLRKRNRSITTSD